MNERELESRLRRLLREPPPSRSRPRVAGVRAIAAVPLLATAVLVGAVTGARLNELRDSGQVGDPGMVAVSPTPSALPSECHAVSVANDRPRPRVDALGHSYSEIWAVRVLEIGEPQWSPAQSIPERRWEGEIYRPVTFEITHDIRGARFGGQQRSARYLGGVVGCDSFSLAPYPKLEVGERYVVFVGNVCDAADPSTVHHVVWHAWPVRAGDTVVTDHDGTLALGNVAERLAPRYVRDEVVVKFKADPTASQLAAFEARHGLRIMPSKYPPTLADGRPYVPSDPWRTFKIVDGVDALPKSRMVSGDPLVEAATINLIGQWFGGRTAATGPSCPPDPTPTPSTP